MVNPAGAWRLRSDRSNSSYYVRKYKERKRERFLTPGELARLGHTLEDEETLGPAAVAASRRRLCTGRGARRSRP